MKSRPILFSYPMIRAILNGTKTQTRRLFPCQSSDIVKVTQHETSPLTWLPWFEDEHGKLWRKSWDETCRFGKVGDRLWVKETHLPKASGLIYRADYDPVEAAGLGGMYGGWKPSIFCRREYSRITLEITGIRVERLQDINAGDAVSEGVLYTGYPCPIKAYTDLWESINGKGSWGKNPLVWVVTFKSLPQTPSECCRAEPTPSASPLPSLALVDTSREGRQGIALPDESAACPASLDWSSVGGWKNCIKCGRQTWETNLGECKSCRGDLWLSLEPDQRIRTSNPYLP